MALKIPGLKFFTAADAKSRVFIIFAAVVTFAFIIYLAVRFLGGGETTGGSRVANAPKGLQSVPGAKMSPEFYRAVEQANQQNAQQAQISGGSAVPTLINMPTQAQPVQAQGNCTVLCNEEAVNVADDINDLVKSGKLSQEDANKLLAMAKNNVPISEYAAELNELVREGKLTPEQARKLLADYTKQHQNALAAESGQTMDALIKSGQLPIDVANQLLALQKNNVSPADYSTELTRLAREGKVSPALAAQLLGQYTQQRAREAAKQGAFDLGQMARSGQITSDVAKGLTDLQKRNVPVDQYSAELNRLVAAGKMTPAAAAKLLDQYKAQRASVGAMGSLTSMLSQEQANGVNLLSDLLKNGRISSDVANALYDLQHKCVSREIYQAAVQEFSKQGKIKPDDAKTLIDQYQKLGPLCTVSKKLTDLQGNNANIADYTKALKEAVQSGMITPEMATSLLQEYRGAITPGVAPIVETNIPGTENFARLSQRVQAEQGAAPSPVENTQFEAAATQAELEAAQAEAERIKALSAAMSTQAQSLITAWQPIPMEHKEGKEEEEGKSKNGGGPGGGPTGPAPLGKPGDMGGAALVKAGTILFGVLDTAVDSDYPDTPVLATIVDGPLKGAKLLGKMAVSSANNGLSGNDRVALTFTLMNRDEWPRSKSITAFAIDPDTARTVMASNVDYHYLKRYGALFGGSFLSGYSSAITQSGSVNSTGIFGTSTTTAPISPAGKLAVGMGKVGDALTQAVQKYVDIPPTVKVNSGVGIGILFMSDLTA